MRALPLHNGARALEDDCAVLEIGGETLVLNHDCMAEGTHFRPGADMADVAWKLVASNLSDLAAKGAEPIGVLIGSCLGEGDERFLLGLSQALDAFDVKLLGGDTIKAKGPGVYGLTAIGKATHTPVPSRSGARVGDRVYVTGVLGRAMLGFEGEAQHLKAFNRPAPRLSEGRALAPLVTAIMDVSDGLLLDAFRMASVDHGIAFDLESAMIPVADDRCRDECIRWGDDYELLFTAPSGVDLPVSATRIGKVISANGVPLLVDGEPISTSQDLGFQHRN